MGSHFLRVLRLNSECSYMSVWLWMYSIQYHLWFIMYFVILLFSLQSLKPFVTLRGRSSRDGREKRHLKLMHQRLVLPYKYAKFCLHLCSNKIRVSNQEEKNQWCNVLQEHRKDFWIGSAVISVRAIFTIFIVNCIKLPKKWSSKTGLAGPAPTLMSCLSDLICLWL